MSAPVFSDSIRYIGVDDQTIRVFEGQYPVPNGISYNSYVILDEKVAVMDTVDARTTQPWLDNLARELAGRTPDYLVVQHMEPDHAANVANLMALYPEMKIVSNAKVFPMITAFFGNAVPADRQIIVKEGDTLSLGAHTLTFVMAPMVHWPEVMMSYESAEKILFSADGFGKFGTLDTDEPWLDESRRYFLNIVGKYGAQVQAVLKKAAGLDIRTICPLHGPVLTENLGYYIGLYDTWSRYVPEERGTAIFVASAHGNTLRAAQKLFELLENKGRRVTLVDLSQTDVSEAVAQAFRYDTCVFASITYDGMLFPTMESLISHLAMKTWRGRRVALMENGSWAPMAAKLMRAKLETLKDITFCENQVSIKSALNAASLAQLEALAAELA